MLLRICLNEENDENNHAMSYTHFLAGTMHYLYFPARYTNYKKASHDFAIVVVWVTYQIMTYIVHLLHSRRIQLSYVLLNPRNLIININNLNARTS